jgi:hypothetical protein
MTRSILLLPIRPVAERKVCEEINWTGEQDGASDAFSQPQ